MGILQLLPPAQSEGNPWVPPQAMWTASDTSLWLGSQRCGKNRYMMVVWPGKRNATGLHACLNTTFYSYEFIVFCLHAPWGFYFMHWRNACLSDTTQSKTTALFGFMNLYKNNNSLDSRGAPRGHHWPSLGPLWLKWSFKRSYSVQQTVSCWVEFYGH